ncbi:MAG: hypothetical protein ACLQIQ_09660 [Beijerinckiaceae bacterium]
MGFELFVKCVRNKELSRYDRKIAERIFNRDAIDPTIPLTGVQYADGSAEIYGAEHDPMSGVMLAHFSGETVLERALELADETGSLIFWPGHPPLAAITNLALLDHLPDDLVKGWKPVLVRTVDRLIKVIKRSI